MTLEQLQQKAELTAELGRATATYLLDILKKFPHESTDYKAFVAERIRLCNDPKNFWFAKDFKARNGDRFNASGKYFHCNSVVCSSCQQHRSRDKRRRLRSVLKLIEPRSNESFQFVTLTVPNGNRSLYDNHKFVDYAFSLLRKRKWFIETFRGAVKCYEFTKTPKGMHFHVHMLSLSRYIQFNKLRVEWTDCVRKALKKKFDEDMTVHTADQLLFANVKKVYDLDSMVFELTKYITKSDSWLKVKQLELLEYATADQLPRMFEMLGKFRLVDQELRGVGSLDEAGRESEGPIVHKTKLNDGGSPNTRETWRDYVKGHGLANAIHRLYIDFDAIKARRLEHLEKTHPYTSIIALPYLPIETATESKRHRSLKAIYAAIDAFNPTPNDFHVVDWSSRQESEHWQATAQCEKLLKPRDDWPY